MTSSYLRQPFAPQAPVRACKQLLCNNLASQPSVYAVFTRGPRDVGYKWNVTA